MSEPTLNHPAVLAAEAVAEAEQARNLAAELRSQAEALAARQRHHPDPTLTRVVERLRGAAALQDRIAEDWSQIAADPQRALDELEEE